MKRLYWKAFKRLRRLFTGKYFTYFAGPMDLAKNRGTKWRVRYAPKLVKMVPVIVQDPAQEQCRKFGAKTVDECHEILNKIREEKGEDAYFRTAKKNFKDPDLRMVRNSDWIVVYWDFQTNPTTVGTIDEMSEAVKYKTPIYFLTDETDLTQLSSWAQILVWESGGKIFADLNTSRLFKRAFEYLRGKYGDKKRDELIKKYSDEDVSTEEEFISDDK